MHATAVSYFRDLQDRICAGLAARDGGATFREDVWDRPAGGGGRSRVMENGAVFEKGGVNFSEVFGEFSPEFAKQIPGDGLGFTAAGVSLVIHPRSPLVPTVHANFRFLTHGAKAWFGGGADLTPYYPFKEDVVHFHRAWKAVCDAHPATADHAKMKADCDEYFHIKHRNEARGVGGIFFDYMDATDAAFAFVRAAGDAFLGGVPADRGAPQGAALHPGPAVLPGVPPGAVRGVQPGVRPRHGVRSEDRRAYGEHSDEPPAGGAVRVRPPPRARHAGGRANRLLAEAEGLGRDGVNGLTKTLSSYGAPVSLKSQKRIMPRRLRQRPIRPLGYHDQSMRNAAG